MPEPLDSRLARAVALHHKATATAELAGEYREARDRIIHTLRAEDPNRWTYPVLAGALDVSRELIGQIVRRGKARQSA